MMSTDSTCAKTIVIIGASSGLGKSLAYMCARGGHNVVLAGRRSGLLREIASEITSRNGSAIFAEADVTDAETLARLFQRSKERFGTVDVIIYCSGVMKLAPLSERRVKEWIQMTEVNYLGALRTFAASYPIIEEQKNGHYIFISSVAGLRVATPDGTVYSASKSALRTFAEGLRQEAGKSCKVTIVSPGAFKSELISGIENLHSQERLEKYYEEHAVSSDEVASAIYSIINQSHSSCINEIVIRPLTQIF